MSKVYKWTASSDDGSWNDESDKTFPSQEECYNDMRVHALDKMKWNTEWEDFSDIPMMATDGIIESADIISVDIHFSPNSIWHNSYSGTYIWKIKCCDKNGAKPKEALDALYDLTDEMKNDTAESRDYALRIEDCLFDIKNLIERGAK